jgi:3-oxoacyl-[acyl-carrier-protein] synthase I
VISPVVLAAGACCPIGTRAWQIAASIDTQRAAFTRTKIATHRDHLATISWLADVPESIKGVDRLVHLATPALTEALGQVPGLWPLQRPVPLFIALPEPIDELPDRINNARFALELPRAMNIAPEFLPVTWFNSGEVGGAEAIARAIIFLDEHPEAPYAIVGGVDSLCDAELIDIFYKRLWIQVNGFIDGFVASEGAAFLVLGREPIAADYLRLSMPAFGAEKQSRVRSERSLSGDGLISAVRGALINADFPAGETGFNALSTLWCDIDGAQWRGSEITSLSAAYGGGLPAVQRIAQFTGQLGAAWVSILVSLLLQLKNLKHHPLGAQEFTGHTGLIAVNGLSTRQAALIGAWWYSHKVEKQLATRRQAAVFAQRAKA